MTSRPPNQTPAQAAWGRRVASMDRRIGTRLTRFERDHARTSLLSVPAAAGLEAVGFDAVGDVMGCTVRELGWQGYGSCGRQYGSGRSAISTYPVRLSNHTYSPFRQYASSNREGYRVALRRAVREAEALGADGIVGVRLERVGLGEECHEFTAFGTAVRARSNTRAKQPFTTDLAGTDFAKLLLSGWVPTALQIGFEVGVRHDDWSVVLATQRSTQVNVEATGLSELMAAANAGARNQLATAIAQVGGEGGLLSTLHTATWAHSCDHATEVLAVGTSIARMTRPRYTAPAPLSILPVRNRTGGTR